MAFAFTCFQKVLTLRVAFLPTWGFPRPWGAGKAYDLNLQMCWELRKSSSLSWTMATLGGREGMRHEGISLISLCFCNPACDVTPSWRHIAKWGFLRHLEKGEWNSSSDFFSPEARDKWTGHFPRISWATDGPWPPLQRMVAIWTLVSLLSKVWTTFFPLSLSLFCF